MQLTEADAEDLMADETVIRFAALMVRAFDSDDEVEYVSKETGLTLSTATRLVRAVGDSNA